MHKCNECGLIFDEPVSKRWMEFYQRPFGEGCEGYEEYSPCCPNCESENFEEFEWEWDGEHCPCCGDKLELPEGIDIENFEKECPKCKYHIEVEEGELKD